MGFSRGSGTNNGQIPLGENIHIKSNVTVTDGTYIAFIVLMFVGACLALFLCDATKIVRPDGSKVVLMKNPSWRSEFVGLYTTLRSDPYIILLFPMFWASNWFYTYQQNAINGAYFDTRTKALNDFLYWFAQIVAATLYAPLLDIKYFRRSVRAKLALGAVFVLTMAIYGGGYAWQKGYTRESVDTKKTNFVPMDWTTSGYVGPMFLYFFYGFYDAIWQASVYWYGPRTPSRSLDHCANGETGLWALSATPVGRPPTMWAFIRAFSRPVPLSCGAWTTTNCPS
jgi:hypothetical protein